MCKVCVVAFRGGISLGLYGSSEYIYKLSPPFVACVAYIGIYSRKAKLARKNLVYVSVYRNIFEVPFERW